MKLEIEKLIYEGFGLGHQNDGKSVFVRKSVLGDELDVEIIKAKKSYSEAIIKSIIKPSEKRTEPRCPYFENCGGCDHQNISYQDQLYFKDQIIDELILRSHIEAGERLPIIPGSNEEYFYRNSIRFEFIFVGSELKIARHNYLDSSKPVVTDFCLLQSEFSNTLCQAILKLYNSHNYAGSDLHKFCSNDLWQIKIREGKQTGEFMLEMITQTDKLPLEQELKTLVKTFPEVASFYHTIAPQKNIYRLKRRLLLGRPVIYEKIGNFTFQISPESFFQTNSLGVKNLYDQIKQFANIRVGDSVFDLFCGTGSIAIYLSTLAKSITGIELVPEAILDAKDNAKINKIHNVEFLCADAQKIKSDLMVNLKDQIVIVDPPRAGLTIDLIEKLSKAKTKRIVYVSCNPATFFRDIQIFNKYGLSLKKLQPVDMFPQTHHIELVGLLS